MLKDLNNKLFNEAASNAFVLRTQTMHQRTKEEQNEQKNEAKQKKNIVMSDELEF